MRFKLSQALSPSGFRRACDFLLKLILFTTTAVIGPPALGSDIGDDQTTVQQQQPSAESRQLEGNNQVKQTDGPEPGAPSTAASLCEALAAAATTNDLPVDFFKRLIWQESHFKPDAISRKGAQGIAQFMPETAKLSGLENPFNPTNQAARKGEC
jgi:hypothetical protein